MLKSSPETKLHTFDVISASALNTTSHPGPSEGSVITRINPRRFRESISRRRIFLSLREVLISAQLFVYRKLLGMDIGEDVRISLRARMDFTNPSGVHIGDGTYVAFDSVIFSHDMTRLLHLNTYVGKNCFIGAKAIVMPGIRIGDSCIIGAGAVVTKDVPAGSIVVGNPGAIIRSGIITEKWGILQDAYARGTTYAR